MLPTIRQKDDPILRQPAAAVTEGMPSARINRIIVSMCRALESQEDGVALAAPQIGVSLRIFIVSSKVFKKASQILVFINPRIIKQSRRQVEMVEGCLSVRRIYGRIKRREKVTIEAMARDGKRFTRHTSGLVAQIVQHEIDHLDGILFIDKAHDLTEIK